MIRKLWILFIVLTVGLSTMMIHIPAGGQTGTTSITVTKYASDGTTILDQVTKTVAELESELPVQGDGITRYYHQGPTFDLGNLWDPGEAVNIDSRDMGRPKGTAIRDLCELVGGASAGDVIGAKASDNFIKLFDYEDVYSPEPEQGELVICWYNADFGGYVPGFSEGMRLVFFAETTNGDGKYVFGNWDMHETLAESRWHYYYDGTYWPSSSGLSVKYIDRINIYSSDEAPQSGSSASLDATANVILPIVGIELDLTSVDYGNLMPGQNSVIKKVVIDNTGTLGCDVTLEIQGDDDTAQSFYEQSLFVDGTQYDIDDVIASITVGNSQSVDTQLRLPLSWDQGGEQKAKFIFWAEAQ